MLVFSPTLYNAYVVGENTNDGETYSGSSRLKLRLTLLTLCQKKGSWHTSHRKAATYLSYCVLCVKKHADFFLYCKSITYKPCTHFVYTCFLEKACKNDCFTKHSIPKPLKTAINENDKTPTAG